MTEKSYLWTTGGAGDGAAEYTRADWQWITWAFSACFGGDGVGPTFLNALVGSVPSANTARIATGVAIVDGKPYKSDASVDVTIPSAVGGGNTRIDRIVLRADWSAQTVRITRIAGTDAASPTAPAITQTSGTTYDILLYQALVNTSGTVTLTDERTVAMIDTGDLRDGSSTNAKIRQGAACSLIGRSPNGGGTVADIVAGANDRVLARQSDALSFVQVATGMIANDAVDDTKAGNRVPQFYRRQGGSSTNWNTTGATAYTPGAVRMQAGVTSVTVPAASTSAATLVTFPVAFSYAPVIIYSLGAPTTAALAYFRGLSNYSLFGTGCYIQVTLDTAPGVDRDFQINWLAIGPE